MMNINPKIVELGKKISAKDTRIQELAAYDLGIVGKHSNEAEDILLKNLNNSVDSVRKIIICSLGKIKSKKSVPHLIQILNNNYDSDHNWVTAEALGNIASKDAIQPLIGCLKKEKTPNVKAAIVRAIGKFNTKESYLALIKASNDDDYWVRQDAIEALKKIANQSQSKKNSNKSNVNIDNGKISNSFEVRKLNKIYQENDFQYKTGQINLKSSLRINHDDLKIKKIKSIQKQEKDVSNSDINTSWKVFRIRQKLEEQFSQNGWVEDIDVLDNESYSSNCRKYYASSCRDIKSLKDIFPDFYRNSSEDEKRFIELADTETLDDKALQKMKVMIKENDSEEWEDSLFEISLRLAEVNKEHPYASQRFFKKVVINGFTFLLICFKFKYPLNEKNMVLFQLTSYDCEKPFPPGVDILVKDIELGSVINGEAIDEPPGLELFFTFSSEPKFDLEITLDND